MILFLAITSMINIGLGFALGVRFGRLHPGARRVADGIANRQAEWAPDAARDRYGDGSPPEYQAQTAKERHANWPPVQAPAEDASRRATGPHGDQVAPSEVNAAQGEPDHTDVERHLLAGIEQFRNQLAQIKGQGETAASAGMRIAPPASK